MEVLGVPVTVGTIGSLVSICWSIVQGINTLHQDYKFMDKTLSSIVNTCNVTKFALGQVNNIFADKSRARRPLPKEHIELFEGIKIGCAMTLSLLETHVYDLLGVPPGDVSLAAQKTGKRKKLKAVYNESDMKILHGQLKDYHSTLNTILNVSQSHTQDEMMHMLEECLQNMLEAGKLYHKYHPDDGEGSVVNNDTFSMLSFKTNSTDLTAFEFDAIIMETAVYKRCMQR
ncbi:hypothetical protein MBLNU457_4602t1 [Dothideomycetes sp. NU457]